VFEAAPDTAAAPKSSAPARALEFQLESDNGRVAVRVADRAGAVTVDVRTADTRLAGALRTDLPELASRFDQTGYRAEIWHPAGGSPSSHPAERPRMVSSSVPSDASHNQSARDHGRRRDSEQDDSESPRPSSRKTDRKDFQWLFTSIR
jgi:hypothetical protein